MNEQPSILDQIQYYSYRYLSKEEIALILDIGVWVLNDAQLPEGKAFLSGRYKRKAEFHDSIIQLSKQLSSPAMVIEQKIAEQTYLNDSRKR